MSTSINSTLTSGIKLSDVQSYFKEQNATKDQKPAQGDTNDRSFFDHLKDQIVDVNKAQLTSDKLSMEMATGKSEEIHETMLALSHAELSFNFMVQVRNKALEAYQEVMRIAV